MQATRALWKHQPLIKFLGKRSTPSNVDHTPRAHPVSPTHSLPSSFASYRQTAQQHGPLASGSSSSSSSSSASKQSSTSSSSTSSSVSSSPPSSSSASPMGGLRSGKSGKSLGSVEPKQGEFFDRDELPRRFRRMNWSEKEMEALESGGASFWG